MRDAGCLPSNKVPCRNRQSTHGRTRVKGRQIYYTPCPQSCSLPCTCLFGTVPSNLSMPCWLIVCASVPAHCGLFSDVSVMCQMCCPPPPCYAGSASAFQVIFVQQLSISARAQCCAVERQAQAMATFQSLVIVGVAKLICGCRFTSTSLASRHRLFSLISLRRMPAHATVACTDHQEQLFSRCMQCSASVDLQLIVEAVVWTPHGMSSTTCSSPIVVHGIHCHA